MKRVLPSLLAKPRQPQSQLELADQARDAGNYTEAAQLYAEHLASNPNDGPYHVQCAHMYKELGRLHEAGEHYRIANSLLPDDADLQIQIGHYHKVCGRIDDALTAYRRATQLDPGNQDAQHQLAAALPLAKASRGHQIAIGVKLMAKAKHATNEGDYLRNVPADAFDQAVEAISVRRTFFLLEGLEQRFPDNSLPDESVASCLQLCLDAQAIDIFRAIVEALLLSKPTILLPASLLLRSLATLEEKHASDTRIDNMPLAAQIAMLSTANNIIERQRAILDALTSSL